jgi:hypothetical protein
LPTSKCYKYTRVTIERAEELTGTFAHAVDLKDGDVDAHEVVERVLHDRGGPGETELAARQPKPGPHTLEDDGVGDGPAEGDRATGREEKNLSNNKTVVWIKRRIGV